MFNTVQNSYLKKLYKLNFEKVKLPIFFVKNTCHFKYFFRKLKICILYSLGFKNEKIFLRNL